MTTTSFPLTDLQRLRRRAAKLAQAPLFGPEGWSKSAVDPMKVLRVFGKCLWIKDGYILRAYQLREYGGKANGVVWAMPVHAEFPEPYRCKKDRKRVLQPPRPLAALDNEMEAIEGDGSWRGSTCCGIWAKRPGFFDLATTKPLNPWSTNHPERGSFPCRLVSFSASMTHCST